MWRCHQCGFILAVLDKSKELIKIKYKDMYVQCKGGKITIICRRCGAINYAGQKPGEKGGE